MTAPSTIAPASPADIPAIMQIESQPAYEGLVGRCPQAWHLAEMALPSSRYLVLRDSAAEVAGFALLQGFGDPDRKLHLKRIAVREPGQGAGSLLLQGMLDWVYRETETNRIDLDVFLGNARARRVYEKAGFVMEGVLRDYHRDPDGSFRSMALMSVLRRDWEARAA